MGYISPSVIVLRDRDGMHEAPLTVQELRSDLDGMAEWAQLSSVKQTTQKDELGRIERLHLELAASEGLGWSQGGAEMKIITNWSVGPSGRIRTVKDDVSLISKFPTPQPVDVHLKEHRKVASFLSLVFGCSINFRDHSVRDPLFTEKTMGGRIVNAPFCQLFSQRTIKEYGLDRPQTSRLQRPIVSCEQIGDEGLKLWSSRYEEWQRFILPAVSAVNRGAVILENVVVNAAMSMEAAGSLIGVVPGEEKTYGGNGKPNTTTFMYRCLIHSGWKWDAVCEDVPGLAKAMATNYNTIKHFDRGGFPDPKETSIVSSVALLVIRSLAVSLTTVDRTIDNLIGDSHHDFEMLTEEVDSYGIRVTSAGVFASNR